MAEADEQTDRVPDLAGFFITGVRAAGGVLTVEIESEKSTIRRIEFKSHEAFQLFHESDFHPILKQYELIPVTPVYQGDWAVFRVENSPFYDLFRRANGRFLTEFPLCFLIATADEHVEVITFEKPSFA